MKTMLRVIVFFVNKEFALGKVKEKTKSNLYERFFVFCDIINLRGDCNEDNQSI